MKTFDFGFGNFKKPGILFLIFIFVFCFSACSRNTENTDNSDNAFKQPKLAKDTHDKSKDKATLGNTEDVSEINTKAEYERLQLDINRQCLTGDETVGEHYRNYIDEYFEIISLGEESAKKYPGLDNTLNELSVYIADGAYADMNAWKEQAKYTFEDQLANGEIEEFQLQTYQADSKLFVQRADENILSIFELYTLDMGSDPMEVPMIIASAYCYDTKTGLPISLEDVITDIDALKAAIIKELRDKYKDFSFSDLEEKLDSYNSRENVDNGQGVFPFEWLIDNQGIRFFFDGYHLGSEPEDGGEILQVAFLFDDSKNKNLFTGKYAKAEGDWVMEIPFQQSPYDLNNDGTLKNLEIITKGFEDNAMPNSCEINIAGSIISVEQGVEPEIFSMDKARLVCTGDRIRLYLTYYADGTKTLIYNLEEGNMGKITRLSGDFVTEEYSPPQGGLEAQLLSTRIFTNPYHMNFTSRTDIIGSYRAERDFIIDERHGLPEPVNEFYFYRIDEGTGRELTAMKDMKAEIVKEDGENTGKIVEIHSGDKLSLYRTDDKNYVDFHNEKGEIIRISVENEDGAPLIDGDVATEVFEGVMWVYY